jgi:hypothetical protein
MRRINAKARKRKKTQKKQRKTLDTSAPKRPNPLAKPTGEGKRGRRTIQDNDLVGARNGWLAFFEKVWHEIGWQLIEIRSQEAATIDDVRMVFESLRSKPSFQNTPGFHWTIFFLQGVPEVAKRTELRTNRIKSIALSYQVQKMRSQEEELKSTAAYAEIAVQQAREEDREVILSDAKEKKRHLQEFTEKLAKTESERSNYEKKVREQETHLYCAELLGFLCKGKYAVKPLPLANSLAGLPHMGWRQSLARCSKMPPTFSQVQYPYGIVRAILKIWKRRSKNPDLTLTDLFRAEIPKLRKPNSEARTYLSEGWRDLRMAIERLSKEGPSDSSMPYAITGAFVSNQARAKNHAERILAERERLLT